MAESGALFFVLMAGLAGSMALVYVPLRIFLTATARSRRLRLLQRIRRRGMSWPNPLIPDPEGQAITMPPSTCSTWPVM